IAGIWAVIPEEALAAQNVQHRLLLLGTQTHSARGHWRQRMFDRRHSAIDRQPGVDRRIRSLGRNDQPCHFIALVAYRSLASWHPACDPIALSHFGPARIPAAPIFVVRRYAADVTLPAA